MIAMNCTVHPDKNSVGNCISCGRPVCEECKVRIKNLVHCRECVEAGRVKGGQSPAQAPQLGPPMAPPPVAPMGGLMNRFFFVEPQPRGPPSPTLFKAGAAGALVTAIMCFITEIFIILILTHFYYVFHIYYIDSVYLTLLVVLSHLFMYSLIPAYLGFSRNYGARSATIGLIGFLIFHGISLTVWSGTLYGNLTNSYNPVGSGTMEMFMAMEFIGVALVFLGYPLRHVSFFIPPMHVSRRALGPTWVLLIVAAVLFMAIIGIYVSWLLIALALYMMFQALQKAPVPGTAPNPMTPGGPPIPPPGQPPQHL